MRCPPPLRTARGILPPGRRRAAGTVLGTLFLLVVPVAAQGAPGGPQPGTPELGISMLAQAVGGALLTLVIGGGFVLLAPEYTERTTDWILERPGETFLYGLAIFVAGLVLIVLLTITIVGILLVVPLVIAAVVVAELGYLAAGRAVGDDWGIVLLVAVVVAAFASGVPLLGGLVGFVLACMGFGAWYLAYRDGGGSSSDGDGADIDPASGGGRGPTAAGGAGSGEADATAAGAGDDAPDPADEWTAGFDDEDRH